VWCDKRVAPHRKRRRCRTRRLPRLSAARRQRAQRQEKAAQSGTAKRERIEHVDEVADEHRHHVDEHRLDYFREQYVDGDTSHWEESGTDYDDDQLPYLVRDYGERVEDARQNAGLQRDELADELDVPESDLLAVEQGRATQAGLGGSLIEALEDELSIELVED